MKSLREKIFLIACMLIYAVSIGQRGASYVPFFLRYGGVKPKKQFEIDKPIGAIVFYKADTINTPVRVEGRKILPVENATLKKINLEDTALHQVVFISRTDTLRLERIAFKKRKLMRVLFDSLSFRIYDDFYSFSKSTDDVHYDELIFEYKANYYEVFDFWATSTKRSMIDVLNRIFSLNLHYKDYKGKEGLLQGILSFKNQAIADALLKNE